jgi:hypothetical protein
MVTWHVGRRGAGTLGCLFSLLIFAAVLYYGGTIGRLYWRFYQVQDAMKSQARLAPSITDDVIRRRLIESSDEILMRPKPLRFTITRGGKPSKITITTEYADTVDLPFFKHVFEHRPRAEEPL